MISTNSTAKFDYESQPSYTLDVSAFDGEYEDVKRLTVNIADINEKPFFTAVTRLGDVFEDATKSMLIMDLDSADPDGDVLTYEITDSVPSGPPFTIDSNTGKFAFEKTTRPNL